MAKKPRHELTPAEARYQALLYELKLLTLAFPHLTEAFEHDDLPIPFLLKRGAARAAAKVEKARRAKASKKAAPKKA